MNHKTFFMASEDALNMISREYDLIHPLRVSLKYVRNEVAKLPDIALAQSIIDPNEDIHGVNYKKAFICDSWEKQEEEMAWILLNSLFSIHEGWASSIYEIFKGADFSKEREFTTNLENVQLDGLFDTYFVPQNMKSIIINVSMQNTYISTLNIDMSKMDKYMLMYRYFKELRNCYMHNNVITNNRVVTTYNNYISSVKSPSDVAVVELPEIYPPVQGQKVKISIRGVIGFSQIIRRIIIISDIKLMMSKFAEQEIINRCHYSNWIKCTLSGTKSEQIKMINKYFKKIGMPKPTNSLDYKGLLVSGGIFK